MVTESKYDSRIWYTALNQNIPIQSCEGLPQWDQNGHARRNLMRSYSGSSILKSTQTDIWKEPVAFVQDSLSCYMQSIFGTQNGDSPLSSYFSPPALQRENKNKLITTVPTRCKVSLSPYHTMRSQLATLTSQSTNFLGQYRSCAWKTVNSECCTSEIKRQTSVFPSLTQNVCVSFTNEVDDHVTIYTNYSHSPLTTQNFVTNTSIQTSVKMSLRFHLEVHS